MSEPLTIDQVAERAGIASELAQEMVNSGILVADGAGAFSSGSVRRAMLVSECMEAGIPMEAIAEAIKSGHLTLSPFDADYYEQRWGEFSEQTWSDVARSTNVPMEFIRRMYEALGYPAPEPGGHPRQEEPVFVQVMSLPLGAGFDEDALVRLMRVYGESMRRITRSETALWHENIDVPLERSGASQREILESGTNFGAAITSVIDQAMLSVYHRMQEREWMNDLVEHVELALVEAGVYSKPTRPSTVAFMDVSGYTALTETRGDIAAAELASSLATIVQEAATRRRGEALKWLGDGVMFRFQDPAEGVIASLEVVGSTVPSGLPPAHVGMHVGTVVERFGDLFGRTVNLASRISSVAGPGEVLVTKEIVEASAGGGLSFDPVGPAELKGVANPIDLFRARLD